MKRHTKIIATLGPATEEKAVLISLVKAGLNIARLNFSHGNYPQFKKIAKNVRAASKQTGKPVTIMQDLQGPKIRLSKEQAEVEVKRGQKIVFSTKANDGDAIYIPNCSFLSKIVKAGQHILIEDGLIRTKVVSKRGHRIHAKVLSGGILKPCKGVNLPDSTLPASAALTPKDRKDLAFGIKTLKVDAVAISFVESAADIERVRDAIEKMTKRPVLIIAKIERKAALKNLEAITAAADGLMVARGDLGIETKPETVPISQKLIIALARREGKPVIVATQMLQSMVDEPIATRAEVSDVANAIFDHADGIMLSNESAVGDFPVRAVQTLAEVAAATEEAIFKQTELFPVPSTSGADSIEDESMSLNACRVADEIDAAAIVVMTQKGFTARTVLKHRPKTPVIIVTQNKAIIPGLNFLWGANVIVHQSKEMRSEDTKNQLKKAGILKAGTDVVLIKLSSKKRSLVVMKA